MFYFSHAVFHLTFILILSLSLLFLCFSYFFFFSSSTSISFSLLVLFIFSHCLSLQPFFHIFHFLLLSHPFSLYIFSILLSFKIQLTFWLLSFFFFYSFPPPHLSFLGINFILLFVLPSIPHQLLHFTNLLLRFWESLHFIKTLQLHSVLLPEFVSSDSTSLTTKNVKLQLKELGVQFYFWLEPRAQSCNELWK